MWKCSLRLFAWITWYLHNICHGIGTFNKVNAPHSNSTNSINYAIRRWENICVKRIETECVYAREGEEGVREWEHNQYAEWFFLNIVNDRIKSDPNFKQLVVKRENHSYCFASFSANTARRAFPTDKHTNTYVQHLKIACSHKISVEFSCVPF